MSLVRIRIWDLPTRIFHWLLALTVSAALVSGQLGGGWIDWHGRLGIFAAGLLAFRLVWGFGGSTYACFAQFFPTPARIRSYLAGTWRGEGHNPLGALSVFALLAVLTVQIVTGLFANDDIAFVGPLFDCVGKDWSNRLTRLHHLAGDGVQILVALHIAAILFYVHVKKHNLLKPMVSGDKEIAATEAQPARGGGWLALIIALFVAAVAIYGASGLWLPAPPPAPVAAPAPSW